MILGIKDMFVLLEIAFAVFFVLLLLFIIPKDLENEGHAFIYDTTGIIENFIVDSVGLEEMEERKGEFYVNSREELIEGLVENKSAIGLVFSENADGTYNNELLVQPYTAPWMGKYIDYDIEDLYSILKPPAGVYPPDVYGSIEVTSLEYGLRDEIPFNKRIMPAILLMMVGIIGMFAMVSLIGQERTDLTIRAYRITPGRLWEFLVSKHIVILITGFICFSVLYLPMMGISGYFPSLLIMVLTVLMGSGIGVILGSYFKNPMGAMLWVLLLMLVLALPAVSLFLPTFSPEWLKFIPSYHTLFGLDAAMFPDNNSHVIWQGAAVLGGISIVLLPLSALIFTGKIRREA